MSDLSRRVRNLVGRGVVGLVNAATKLQTLQIRLLAGEVKDKVEHFEPYGFTSHALPGAEHVTLFMDGDRSHGVTIVVADRRYRLQGLPAGAVALHDNVGTRIVLSADGEITVTADTRVTIDAPLVRITGSLQVDENIVADGDISDQGDKSMSGMRDVFNDHDHDHGDPAGTTAVPNQQQ